MLTLYRIRGAAVKGTPHELGGIGYGKGFGTHRHSAGRRRPGVDGHHNRLRRAGGAAASPLTPRERWLCIEAALLGCQGMGTFRRALAAALDGGVEPAALREVLCQATAYLGIGRVRDFLLAADEIMVQHGIRLPLPARGTTDAATRFDRGLAKQAALFGEGMAKVQADGPAARRNINRWLAANCFGDYYTRTGLDDREREMVTFCFLLAQGGCENQLRGHARGSLGMGNGKARLYAFAEQCLPYIGYPRTLNAMNIVDEVTAGAP